MSVNPEGEEIVPIAEAARRLGVSERTVYRMVRAGKIRRVSMSDNSVNLSDRSFVAVGFQSQNVPESVSIMSDKEDNLSDMALTMAMDSLREELRQKDTQIGQLIDAQKDLTQTVGRLQEQLVELARYVLTENREQERVLMERQAEEDTGRDKKRGTLAALFALGRRPREDERR